MKLASKKIEYYTVSKINTDMPQKHFSISMYKIYMNFIEIDLSKQCQKFFLDKNSLST